jgi:hypothetical protein
VAAEHYTILVEMTWSPKIILFSAVILAETTEISLAVENISGLFLLVSF